MCAINTVYKLYIFLFSCFPHFWGRHFFSLILYRRKDSMYTVYRLENIVTKKNYIGMTSQKPNERWCGDYAGKMKEAIDAYPLDLCWKKHIEFQTPNKNQALELESELMKWYDSVDNGYNVSEYGSGYFKRSEESKQKMSDNHADFSGEKNPMFGKHHSEETKNKIRENTPSKPVLQFSKDGKLIAEYPSTKEAERKTGCNQGHICS